MSFVPDEPVAVEYKPACSDPGHTPPTHYFFPASGYWVCPSCGFKTRVGSSILWSYTSGHTSQ